MFAIETTTDECSQCRVCHGCLAGVHSCCFPVGCINGPTRHDCACDTCKPRRDTT